MHTIELEHIGQVEHAGGVGSCQLENSGHMSPVMCEPFVHDLLNADLIRKGGLRGAVFEPY